MTSAKIRRRSRQGSRNHQNRCAAPRAKLELRCITSEAEVSAGGSVGAQSGGDAQGGSGSTSISASDSKTGQSISVGTDPIGAYGQLGTSHTADIGNSMFLQLYGGLDLDQQTSVAPAVNGRVGLGWKY
jgi:hypothetical protein